MFDEPDFDAYDNMMRRIDKHHDEMDAEFQKLICEPCSIVPEKGDTVVVAAGLIGMGHLWIRKAGTIIECGDTSYLVGWHGFIGKYSDKETWVNQALITDVIRKTKPGENHE